MIQNCVTGADGCLDWADGSDCATTGETCSEASGVAACAMCSDDCALAGDSQCNGTLIQQCQQGVDGCLDWVDGVDCDDSGQFCDDTAGAAACVDTCVNECQAVGDSQCSSTIIQQCQAGVDGCLDWVDGTDCNDAGEICDDTSGTAGCKAACATTTPSNPTPADAAIDVDVSSLSAVTWAADPNATGYDVFLGSTCPPPAYPDAAFMAVTSPSLSVSNLNPQTSYCWQVVSHDDQGCESLGPVWTFDTGCTDPVAGAPTVLSGDVTYPGTTVSDTYQLQFSEPVFGVATNVTWTPVVGTGTMTGVTAVDAQNYTVAFTGAAAGDAYVITVGTAVTDTCGNALSAPVTIVLSIQSSTPVTFDTHNFMGYTEYPLDSDACGCCGATTTAETADAFCVLAGMTSAVSWTTGNVVGTNCYCWDCTSPNAWVSNCCSGSTSRPFILTVTCI